MPRTGGNRGTRLDPGGAVSTSSRRSRSSIRWCRDVSSTGRRGSSCSSRRAPAARTVRALRAPTRGARAGGAEPAAKPRVHERAVRRALLLRVDDRPQPGPVAVLPARRGVLALRTGLTPRRSPWAWRSPPGRRTAGAALERTRCRSARDQRPGLLVLALMVQGADDVTSWTLVPGELVAGMGMGLAQPPLNDYILAGVQDHEVGEACGVLDALQQFAGALGIAVFATTFFAYTDADSERLRRDRHAAARADPAGAGIPRRLSPAAASARLGDASVCPLAVFAAADLDRRGRRPRLRLRLRLGCGGSAGSCARRARPGRRASSRSRARRCGRR